jgi:hypothetical protein
MWYMGLNPDLLAVALNLTDAAVSSDDNGVHLTVRCINYAGRMKNKVD